jgi:LysM domain
MMKVKGAHMTLIDTWERPLSHRDHGKAVHRPRRAAVVRPGRGAVAYQGTGVKVSRAPHRPRPVSATMTMILAAVAALITVWLLALAQARSVTTTGASVPQQLAVVQVQPGENLQRLAARVAPDAPVGGVVARIRELNGLDSAALDAGQTLIAPVG